MLGASLIALAGCTTLPAGIPAKAGTLDASMASEVLAIASPDLPYLIYQTLLEVQTEDFRSCPEYSGDTSNFTLIGDCSDSAGISWEGTGTLSTDTLTSQISLDGFGPSGLAGGWNASGTMEVDTGRGSTSVFITSQVKLVQLDDPAKVYWLDTVGSYANDVDSGLQYSDQYDGTIGIESWGTATVSSQRVSLAFINGCDYACAGFGHATVTGSNILTVEFHPTTTTTGDTGGDTAGDTAGDSAVIPAPPPPPQGDTGPGDTGPGDTAPADSGSDSASDSTATTDSSTSDTGTTTSIEACGCAGVALDGVAGDTCLLPTRTFAWPFIPLGQ